MATSPASQAAPVSPRRATIAGVKLDAPLVEFCKTILAMPEMQEWIHAAREEPDEISELDVEF